MRKITPDIIRKFSKNQILLYQAKLIDLDGTWSQEAIDVMISSLLDEKQDSLVKLATKTIKEQKKYELSVALDDDDEEE